MADRYQLITKVDQFAALRGRWNELVSTCEVDHAFMRHEWFDCWIKAFHTTGSLAIQTAWSDDRLYAIAPLRIVRERRRGLSFNILEFLLSNITPRCNFIVHPDADISSFFDSLFDIPGWDIMRLQALEMEQPITKAFIQHIQRRRDYVIEPGLKSPYEILEGTWESFYQSRSVGYRKNFRNSANRLKKAGDHKVVVLESPEDFEKHFDELMSVSARSWKAEAGTDLRSTPQQEEFYRIFSAKGSKEGLCIAFILYLNERPIAFDYYLRHNRRLAGIRWEYDTEYRYYMPGTTLHAHVIRYLMDTGETWEYDLCGMTSEYKSGLVKSLRLHSNITVRRPGLRGKLIMLMKRAWMRLRNRDYAHEDRSEPAPTVEPGSGSDNSTNRSAIVPRAC
jgi:CelD/BcsL family acetyltransferase involved in cellulose biosynthesis